MKTSNEDRLLNCTILHNVQLELHLYEKKIGRESLIKVASRTKIHEKNKAEMRREELRAVLMQHADSI